MARPAIFRGKLPENNVHGMLTKDGAKAFAARRRELAALVDWKPARVSDGDVIEFLARGEKPTKAYLKSGLVT